MHCAWERNYGKASRHTSHRLPQGREFSQNGIFFRGISLRAIDEGLFCSMIRAASVAVKRFCPKKLYAVKLAWLILC